MQTLLKWREFRVISDQAQAGSLKMSLCSLNLIQNLDGIIFEGLAIETPNKSN